MKSLDSLKETLNIDKNALYIINKLTENGFTACAVGGCIRDLLMNKHLGYNR